MKKEIEISKANFRSNIYILITSFIISIVVFLTIALMGNTVPSNPKNKYSSDICYYGILSKDGYCNITNDGTRESIQVYFDFTLDSYDTPSEKQTWFKRSENERYSIPETFLSSSRKDSDINIIDKLLVIYLPLILVENFFSF